MGQQQKPIATEQNIVSLGRVLQSLREEDNVDALIETIITYIKDQFDYKLIWVALYDPLSHILTGKGGLPSGRDSSYLRQKLVLSPGDLLEQVVIEQIPVGVADLQIETRIEGWQEVAKKLQIQGTIILPIRYKDRCLGLLMLGSTRWGYLLPSDAKARLTMILGEMAGTLHQYELCNQQKQTKRMEEPILQLLGQLQSANSLEQRLESVVKVAHDFIKPSHTHIYWFEREGRYFWRRFSSQRKGKNHENSPNQLSVEDLSDFYYSLSVNEVVAIGNGQSSLKSQFTAQLLEKLKVQTTSVAQASLMAAPIIWQKDLLGFIAVEASEARIWQDTDKRFIQAVAGLISLVAPTAEMDATVQQIRADSELTSQVAQGIYGNSNFEEVLRDCGTKMLSRLRATRFLLLHRSPEENKYQLLRQYQIPNRRSLSMELEELREVDLLLMQHTKEAVAIENINEDLRFFNWRLSLSTAKVRSLMVCNCVPGVAPNSLVVIISDSDRAWTTEEKKLTQIVAQQVGVITRQWELHADNAQQQEIMQTFQNSLRILEQAQIAETDFLDTSSDLAKNQQLEVISLKQIASLLDSPFVVLLSWMPGEEYAKIIPGVIDNNKFAFDLEAKIAIKTEALIQWTLDTTRISKFEFSDIPEETKKWLHGVEFGQILVMVLRTDPNYEPTGLVIIADHLQRNWSEQSLIAAETLICQLAWSRRQKQVTQLLLANRQQLRQLNWYKHRRWEENQRINTALLNQITDIGIPSNDLSQMRYQQLIRQLVQNNQSVAEVFTQEQWQLQINHEQTPIAGILKRSLERVDALIKQHKLWVGIHGLGQTSEDYNIDQADSLLSQTALTVAGDFSKIELVINELLISACQRSVRHGRVDIWCRRLDERTTSVAQASLELSITDNGNIDLKLLTELYEHIPKDLLAVSSLDQPPGINLSVCQNLIKQQAGELNFYQLPDGRIVSRLLLPLGTSNLTY
ncbi:GAF domain-containing protein [Calothrix sp. PCC 6303]|nr:GAF domain protein [Calothrix sp. PCC 6303]